jgi:glyceraldehyde-3-phosphate dehydrogenase/erythrose-4-phosphate dehydrogenase
LNHARHLRPIRDCATSRPAPNVLLSGSQADAGRRKLRRHSCPCCSHQRVISVLDLSPVLARDTVGIRDGSFTTVHAYTNTQSLTDQPMKERRDSWAATENIIPSSSGAAKALKFIWPDLQVTGKACRVPVRTGSIVELTARVSRDISG